MKRILLYSTPTENNINKILELTFPKQIEKKVYAYMPSDGANTKSQYTETAINHAKKFNAKFLYIDNSKENDRKEVSKLLSANILTITGGNTFTLLRNLRKSGLDKAVIEFTKKSQFVLSGFSAGALVLTPTINICNLPNYDENTVGLSDLTGLGVVDFEVFPHYDDRFKQSITEYRKTTRNEVREITDEDFIVIDQ